MNKNEITRLSRVLREINVSLDRAIEYLISIGIEIDPSPNAKIDFTIYKALKEKFNSGGPWVVGRINMESTSYNPPKDPNISEETLSATNEEIPIFDFNPLSHFDLEELEEEVDESDSEIERNKNIWHKYITAQEKIIDYKSLPIAISPISDYKIENNLLKLEVDQDIFKKIFKSEIETTFKLKDFNYDNGHILQDLEITEQIPFRVLENLKESAQEKYIEFNEHPIIEGVIKAKNSNFKALETLIGWQKNNYLFKKEGLLFLTQEQYRAVSQIQNIFFEEISRAVFPISPTISFLLSVIYKKPFILDAAHRFTLKGGRLPDRMEAVLHNQISLERKRYHLNFYFPSKFKIKQKVKDLDKFKGVKFPLPEENCLQFQLEAQNKVKYDDGTIQAINIDDQNRDFIWEVNQLKKVVFQYFPNVISHIDYDIRYSYDDRKLKKFYSRNLELENLFWDKMYTEIHGDDYQLSRNKGTISFDFNNFEELNRKKFMLEKYNYFQLEDYGEAHKYKFHVKFETGLHNLQQKLSKNAPVLVTKLLSNGQQLKFYRHYKPGNKAFVRDHLSNLIREHIDNEIFDVFIEDIFQEKYLCEENFDVKVEQEEEKLSKLRREQFYFGNKEEKFLLGRLQKIDYPNLEFFVEDDDLDVVRDNIKQKTILAIFPDLKGERDKILRLTDTVQKLNSKVNLPNNNVKEFLFDSSKAKPIAELDYLLNRDSDAWKDFEENTLSNYLNDSQKEAIFKSLHSEELMLIQGPPGTGKSTAIAEVIWHHLLRNPKERILLTSETNLAVDNAMDRVKNENNNLVKPIRFGNDEKLASEGLFYSHPTITSFKNNKEFSEPNAVAHWITNISNRIEVNDNEKINSSLIQWKSHLMDMDDEVRSIFSDKYVENVNLIGATGSSMGKLNSEGRYTSFFHSYLKVFNKKVYEPSINYKICNGIDIIFDTIVMDEASKATPPELALPILYGKKAIIVGDHRQLPPMVDGEEIKDTLFSIGEKELANTLSRDEFTKSQFENLFTNPSIDNSIKGTFNTQYRMHPAINNVIEQFYLEDGGLTCGLPLEETEHASFDPSFSRYHGLSYETFLKPETHVIWIDVDTPEVKEGTSRANLGEVNAIDQFLNLLKTSNGSKEYNSWVNTQSEEEKEIGVISFYGKQITHLERMLKKNHHVLPTRLSTVDKFQGMERNIIIVSLVRSNKIASNINQPPDTDLYGGLGYTEQSSLGFAESPNRLNVALSRARRLLVIVGNKNHFCKKDIYKNVYNSIKNSPNGKIITAIDLQNHFISNE